MPGEKKAYGALVITVFRPWYALADSISFVLAGTWGVSLIRVVREMVV